MTLQNVSLGRDARGGLSPACRGRPLGLLGECAEEGSKESTELLCKHVSVGKQKGGKAGEEEMVLFSLTPPHSLKPPTFLGDQGQGESGRVKNGASHGKTGEPMSVCPRRGDWRVRPWVIHFQRSCPVSI